MIEVFDRVSMQVFVRWYYTMIAAAVQCDVDGIPKRSHFAKSTTDEVDEQNLGDQLEMAQLRGFSLSIYLA